MRGDTACDIFLRFQGHAEYMYVPPAGICVLYQMGISLERLQSGVNMVNMQVSRSSNCWVTPGRQRTLDGNDMELRTSSCFQYLS